MQFKPQTLPARFAQRASALAVLALCAQVQAQQTPERVEITGSIIKRVADEGALPVTTIKATELEARGHTELKDLVLEMPQSLSLGTNFGSAGPIINLRGLGPMRTLSLLNGRRMANEPLQDQYFSVNVIPRMALDRAETLRDGASSIYGADAIGGVQNFYTKRSFKGFTIKGEANQPEASGGGDTQSVGLLAGFGDLAKDGWNVYASAEHQRKAILYQHERASLYDGSVLASLGVGVVPTNKNPSPTANFGFSTANNSNYNPSFPTGCLAPYSLPTLGAGSVATPPSYSPGCYRDPNFFNGIGDGLQITNLFAKATWALSANHQLSFEVLRSRFTVDKVRGMQTPSGQQPATTYTMPATSKFYPGKGITPAIQVVGSNTGSNSPTMFINASKTPGTVSALNMNNRPIYFAWGPAELGSAIRKDVNDNDRLVLAAEGVLAGFDYRVGLNYGASQRAIETGGGYIMYSKAQEGFSNGILNPFGLQDAAGLEYLKSIDIKYPFRTNQAFNQSVDATLTRELMPLPGGPLTLAAVAEFRRDSAKVSAAPTTYISKNANGTLAIDAFGNITKSDLIGEAPAGVARKLHRGVSSVVLEVDAPVLKMLTLNAAVRSDSYSDLKKTTVNPKFSFRLQPMQQMVLRGSVSSGFRAPSIMDIQNPTPEVRQMTMDDPVLCPSSTPTVTDTGKPVAGYTRDQVCNVVTDYWTKSPNNSHLKPETSKGFTLGIALEPMKNLTVSADYWGIHVTNTLGLLTLAEVQQQPKKYEANIIRSANGLIDYILTSQSNRGDFRIRGADLSAAYVFPASSFGTIDLKLDGAYYQTYEFTTEKGGTWFQNVGIITNNGVFGGGGPNSGLSSVPQMNFRWKHTASVGWRMGPWRAQVSQRYNTGLTDLTPRAPSTYTEVKGYSQYNFSGSYSGFKNLKLSLGINNVTNVNPMVTANTVFNGYITSVADVLGRAYKVTAEYNL